MKIKIIKISILILTIILIILGIYILNINTLAKEAKEELLNKKNDITILTEEASKYHMLKIKNIKTIENLKIKIKKLEKIYEENILFERCYKAQIERKINGLEYNINYCTDKEHIIQFKNMGLN